MDPAETVKTRFYVNDVGGSVWEEISEAGTDFAGKNYGWPHYEGPCKFGKTDDCPLYNPSANILKRELYHEPLYYYEHEKDREGGCITGGAFVPEGIWPAKYKYLYADFIFHSIFNLMDDPENECSMCLPPVPKYRNETFYTSTKDEDQHENYARVVDIFFGPYKDTQALYVFKMGGGNNVWRIRYTGSDNIPPVAKIEVDQDVVDVGDVVSFDGSQSFDPEELALQYEWDFGDNSFSKEANPIHVYGESGQYTVRLGVTDSANHTQTDSVMVVVGKPPSLSITSPAEGDEFFVGEILTLSGAANDANGEPLSDSQISWEVRKHHADHWHPFLDIKQGNNMLLSPAPEPEDYLAATNSYLEIIMYATDSAGLVSTTSRNVQPRLVDLCIDSEPQGLEVFVDEYPIVTPLRITSWVNHDLRIRAPLVQYVEGAVDNSTFSSWSDGVVEEDREIRLLPDGNRDFLASFCVNGDANCLQSIQKRAADNVLVARCPSKSPTASPTTSPTTAAPTEQVTDAPTETEIDEPAGKDPIAERPVDNEDVWNLVEESAGTPRFSTSSTIVLSVISLLVLFRI